MAWLTLKCSLGTSTAKTRDLKVRYFVCKHPNCIAGKYSKRNLIPAIMEYPAMQEQNAASGKTTKQILEDPTIN